MNQKTSIQQIEQAWARAAERAAQEKTPRTEDSAMLDRGAGLRVKSGVQAGLWDPPNTAVCTEGCL